MLIFYTVNADVSKMRAGYPVCIRQPYTPVFLPGFRRVERLENIVDVLLFYSCPVICNFNDGPLILRIDFNLDDPVLPVCIADRFNRIDQDVCQHFRNMVPVCADRYILANIFFL